MRNIYSTKSNKSQQKQWESMAFEPWPIPPTQFSLMEALLQACATKNTGLSLPPDANLGLWFPLRRIRSPAFLILPSSVLPKLYSKQEQSKWSGLPSLSLHSQGERLPQVRLDDDTWPWSPLCKQVPSMEVQDEEMNKSCHPHQVPHSLQQWWSEPPPHPQF